jgi:hypothetical protein
MEQPATYDEAAPDDFYALAICHEFLNEQFVGRLGRHHTSLASAVVTTEPPYHLCQEARDS